MRTSSAPTTRPRWGSARPHGRPQRRPGQASRQRQALVSETTAEYFYDYAAQDPINAYDLDGDSVVFPPDHNPTGGGLDGSVTALTSSRATSWKLQLVLEWLLPPLSLRS
jgi:hypothetical protein